MGHGSKSSKIAGFSLLIALASGFEMPTAEGSDTGSSTQAIVGGTVSQDDGAVVAITFRGSAFCTGTLISSRIVATAAHCVTPNVDIPADKVSIFFGTDTSLGGVSIKAVAGEAHPQWNTEEVYNDVGVYILAEDAPVAPALLPGTRLDDSYLGAKVRMVGFGVYETEQNLTGLRNSGAMFVDDIDAKAIYLSSDDSTTCSGDSGGTLFAKMDDDTEVFMGVHARSRCEIGEDSSAIDSRLDSNIGFFAPYLAGDVESVRIHGGQCDLDDVCNPECVIDFDCTADAYPIDGITDFSPPAGCSSASNSASISSIFFVLFALLANWRRKQGV